MINYGYLNNDYRAIYINFPFCKLPCRYCHYVKNLNFGYDFIPKYYFNRVVDQLQSVLKKLNNKQIQSIYFGGGTPSLLNDIQIETLRRIFINNNIIAEEVSIEIHPGMCNFDYVNNNFFTRYSIGAQSVCMDVAENYYRTTYNKEKLYLMINSIRESKYDFVINLDFIFDEYIDYEEIEFVNTIKPETVTFYPNTQGRGEERLRNVLKSFNYIENKLIGYSSLAKSKFIFIKDGCNQSNYSKVEYEKYGDIIGIGHNSISYIENDSFLCQYTNNEYIIKKREVNGERMLFSLIMGIITGVTKGQVIKLIPDIYNKHFLLTVCDEIDVSDKHIKVDDDDLVYLPENEYIRFYKYIKDFLPEIYGKIFLSSIGYGDSEFSVINKIYNEEFYVYKNGIIKIEKKIKTPQLRILVEGIDGSGKDTFVRFFVNELKRHFYYNEKSRISVMGQPDSSLLYGKEAKCFVESLLIDGDKTRIIDILKNNRYESEQLISTLPGIVILIRGIVTDKATFKYRFCEDVYLGEGKYLKQWDLFIVIDSEIDKANNQIENRGITRTWREYPNELKYFREYYLRYNDDFIKEKIIICNDSDINSLKNKAIDMAEKIYEQFNK